MGDNIPFNPRNSYSDLYDSPDYQYVISNGKNGTKPIIRNICFKNTGYASMRSNWGNEKSLFLFFSACYKHWSHKHNDDLAFTLRYNSRDILIDCAFFGYEYNKELVQYGYSSYAHNVLVVDNESLGILSNQDKKYSSVGISHWRESSKSISLTGYNNRW